MSRRTEKFEVIPGRLPDVMKPGWGALRNFYLVVRAQQREVGKAFTEVRANSDLTAEARLRREAELRKEMKDAIEPAWETLVAEREKTGSEVERIIDQELNVDPLAPSKVRFSELSAAETELAKLSIDQREATNRVARLLVDDKVDRMLDRAFARDTHKDGAPIFQIYQLLNEAADPLTLRAFESQGLARIRAEGSQATAQALSVMVEAAREARLPEAAKALLDHRDALSESVNFTEGVHGETTTDEFLAGKSLVLGMAPQMIDPAFLGLEE